MTTQVRPNIQSDINPTQMAFADRRHRLHADVDGDVGISSRCNIGAAGGVGSSRSRTACAAGSPDANGSRNTSTDPHRRTDAGADTGSSPTPVAGAPATRSPAKAPSTSGVGRDWRTRRSGCCRRAAEAIVTGWSGAWWQIDLNGETGFVFGEIVTAYRRRWAAGSSRARTARSDARR